ncbi:hypothetical protein Fcan01_16412 [Folsomia candida]|uniref:CCHC-type domain-containing protein n=1 Tax=Folsomia candida TaxID=158441 RepID=A0A226DV97_FOLCA|nr:hypothetical protein Fcan01_16412 [Folsomia candida]
MLLDEDSLMTLIVDHMQPHYQEYFRYKKFASLKALKDALVMFDRRRRDILLTREAEVGGKRKSTLAAILDMDSEDVNLRLARHLPAIQEESEPTTEPMKKMLQKMEQIEAKINSLQSYPERQRQTQPRNQDNQQSRRPQQYGSQDRKTIECYNCHRFGHYRRECYREGGGAYLSRVPQQPQQGNYRNDRHHSNPELGKREGAGELRGPSCPEDDTPTTSIIVYNLGLCQQIYVVNLVNGREVPCLIDPGAGVSCIEYSLVKTEEIFKPDKEYRLSAANQEEIKLLGATRIQMEFGRIKFELNVLVSRDLPKGLFIVGNDVLSHFSPVKIDYDEKTVELRGSEKVDFSYSRDEVPEGGQTIRPRSADRSVDNRETRTANGTRRRREEGGSEGDCPLRALTYHQLERPDQPLDWSAGERGWTISTIPVGRGDHLRGRSSQRVRGSSPDLIEEKVSEKQTIANEGEERERGKQTIANEGEERERGKQTIANEGEERERGKQTIANEGEERERGKQTIANEGEERERGKQTIANEGERERKRSGVPSTSGYKERTRSIQKTSRASEKTQQRSRNCDTNTRHKPVKDRRSGAEGANNFLNTIRVDETEDVPEISTVKIKSTLCIEPNSCVVVPVNLGRKVQGDDIYFQPSLVTELKYGIKLRPGIMDKKHLFVSIWNLSPRILTLFRGTVLGLGRPCKEAIESKLMSIAGMGTSDGKIPKTKEPFDTKYFDINPDADPKDKEELIDILTEFWDVFAHDNTDEKDWTNRRKNKKKSQR